MSIGSNMESRQHTETQINRIDPFRRCTLRGLKKCTACGELNGQRASLCRNMKCPERKEKLAHMRPFDPIQLTDNTGSLLYSVLNKEHNAQQRNFVQITEMTFTLEQSNDEIVSRNSVCFIDTCKYDACDVTSVVCKHIKACTHKELGKAPIPKAEVYTVSREVLFNLNIGNEQKNNIWDLYKVDENCVPAVQRLNATMFAVKCASSKVFPAGRLHVNVSSTGKPKKHACACKKLKIIVDSDNSVVMQDDICEHLLLVLAAVLSHPNGKTEYAKFTSELKYIWMPATLDKPLRDTTQDDPFLSISIGGDMQDDEHLKSASEDIFIFDDKFMSADVFPDFSDIILDLESSNELPGYTLPAIENISKTVYNDQRQYEVDNLHQGDLNFMSSCDLIENCSMDLQDTVNAPQAITTFVESISPSITPTHLELTDCNIELMDEFQLTDHLDICSEDLTSIPIETTFDDKSINILSSAPLQLNTVEPLNPIASTESLLQTNHNTSTQTTTTLPLIELPTIAVVKKCPIKVADIVDEVKTRKFPRIPAKRSLIVNNQNDDKEEAEVTTLEIVTAETEPSLSYSAWLEYVIESINESINVDEENNVKHSFDVHEEIFAHFSKTFSAGNKFRIPNTTTVVKHGRHKGIIKYTWYFTTATTVRRIFHTKNLAIELERKFERCNDGSFKLYIPNKMQFTESYKGRRVYPKLALYVAYICFDSGDDTHNTGLKLEWLPNVFPKSHFGTLTIEFSLGVRDPILSLNQKTARA